MIRIITEPTIRLVGRPQIDFAELARFLEDEQASSWTTDTENDGERLIETAGRLCYHSYSKPRPGGNRAYIGHILEVGHGSVIEHANWNFIITGVSRSLTHELVRHRAGMAYSQRSQRYVDESQVAFVVPPNMMSTVQMGKMFSERWGFSDQYSEVLSQVIMAGLALTPEERHGLEWLVFCENALNCYVKQSNYLAGKMVNFGTGSGSSIPTQFRKKAREAGRSSLPNCTETQIFVTANARALRGMFEQRGVPGADAEIRRLAVAWAKIMMAEAPAIFQDYGIATDEDGEYITFTHRKV